MIDLKELASKPWVMRLGIYVSQRMPISIGRCFGWFVSWAICQFKPSLYRIAIRNLRQVMGSEVDRKTLQMTVRQLIYNTLRNHYYLFRSIKQPIEEVIASVDIPPQTQAIFDSIQQQKAGKILLTAHLGNFDLGAHVISYCFPNIQCITMPNPSPGFQMTNTIRQRAGMNITPLSKAALSKAYRTLEKGGFVLMVVDRIVSNLDKPVLFFGHEARMPSAHIRMALRTNSIVVMGCFIHSTETGRYTMYAEPPFTMIRTGNREEEIEVNMQFVLGGFERMIRRWPEQWQMFVPVWSEK